MDPNKLKTKCLRTMMVICTKQHLSNIWDKVFKSGPSKICGRQPLKTSNGYGCLSRPYHFKFFKGCLLQILLGPLLNTFFHLNKKLSNTEAELKKALLVKKACI